MGIDIKNFYLGTPMKYYQHLHVHHTLITDKVVEEYQFTVEHDGYVYFEIRLCMCGLK